ncbi:hypothetical protein JCM10449v2_006091 [Rhodotorula kratochvilovae]
MGTSVELFALPAPVLDRILAAAIAQDPLLPTALLALSRQAHTAARRVLARELALPDDDALLLDAQSPPGLAPPPLSEGQSAAPAEDSPPSLLKQVLRRDDWAADVRALVVVRPAAPPAAALNGHGIAGDSSRDEDDEDVPPIPPLDDAAFFLVIARLNSLTSFTWSSYRLPPEELCLALGQACKNLASFSLDLVPSPFAPSASDHAAAPGSPQQLASSPSAASTLLGLGNGHSGAASLRWDAPHLSALPLSLARLSLSHLSATGARSLAAALPAFPALEALDLARTLFVDDALLAEIGAGAKALRRLAVREMGGTKLSEVGLQALFDGCEALETLELECVEGRFSRTCWTKLAPLPSSLHTLRLVYSEQPPHKSWVVDHLASLPAILGADSSSLHTLSITRRPHPLALLPGSHHTARYPIEGVVEPRVLGKKAIDALTEREAGGREWRVLELDLFSLDLDGLKRVLEGAPALQRLQVLLDSPFRNLLTLAPSFAACPALRHVLVSVPPQHTPELAPLTPAEYLAAVPPTSSTPQAPTASPPSSPRAAAKEPKEDKHHPLKALDALLPPTRDWRRFCKKAHSLERIAWTGRGGLGQWTFAPGRAGSSLTRVEFEPTRPSSLAQAAEEPRAPASPRAYGGRRRSSTVSLAETCLSNLSLGALTSDGPSSPSYSLASTLATPPPPADQSAPMSFTAAGRSVSPRKDAPAVLAASPPGLGGGFGPIGGGGGGGRRRSSASSGAGGAFPHAGGALGLALSSPPPIPVGWASTLPVPAQALAPEVVPIAIPASATSQPDHHRAEPALISLRSFAAVCGTSPASPPAPGAPAGAGWAESPAPAVSSAPKSNGAPASGRERERERSGGSGGSGRRERHEKQEKEGSSPPLGRRSRGGQGRRRESLK